MIAIVGAPNVGKSLLFNRLTGAYVTVSNYPGTTVEVARGRARLGVGGVEVEVVDTPGMYDLFPLTEEERVARRILLEERPTLVLHVTDAKNLARMLPMTLELMEAGLPIALAVNLMDEAEERGVSLDLEALERRLGVPVVGTVCTSGLGLERLREILTACVDPDAAAIRRCH
jgi:ferrous iron transport protein B